MFTRERSFSTFEIFKTTTTKRNVSVILLDFTRSKEGCKDQESIQSSTTADPGYQWESDKLKVMIFKLSWGPSLAYKKQFNEF